MTRTITRSGSVILAIVAVALSMLASVLISAPRAGAVAGGGNASSHGYYARVIVNNKTLCSGTLISPRAVLTAKHCVRDGANGVALFGNNGKKDRVNFRSAIRSGNSDMAVLRLDRKVRGITPVRKTFTTPKIGSKVTITGWGAQGANGKAQSKVVTVKSIDKQGRIFTKDNRNSQSAQAGDSGGTISQGGHLVGVLDGKFWSSKYGDFDYGTLLSRDQGLVRTGALIR